MAGYAGCEAGLAETGEAGCAGLGGWVVDSLWHLDSDGRGHLGSRWHLMRAAFLSVWVCITFQLVWRRILV